MLKLYTYFRSSSSYRVRIALNYKGLAYSSEAVHLLRNGGEQFRKSYRDINPQSLVPSLETEQGDILTQSLAILEYIEETYPTPPLLPPNDALARARIRGLCLSIACEIHPLNNLRVLKFLKEDLRFKDSEKMLWYHHWLQEGFKPLERELSSNKACKTYCHGDEISMADVCLVPQIYNALRFDYPMDRYPTLMRIYESCTALPAFTNAHPSAQADAEE